MDANIKKNRELLAQLEAKEKALAAEQERLNKLKKDLEASSSRLADLEKMIADKEALMNKLKETLSKSLEVQIRMLDVLSNIAKTSGSTKNPISMNTTPRRRVMMVAR